ncbi:MAG: hypothetical protein HY886_02695 [Deltaproteobacteria bacterium]|nr:hypothetical protein [Deltaproteobacteria bacterium]
MGELKDCIAKICDEIRKGNYPNEASVSQGVVMPILHSLGWPVFDTQTVFPEYSVGGRRVDYALCHKGKPAVFIEVKQVGHSEGADRQLFEYAFHAGVPMAVLTDGQEWHFYLPAEQGDYEERRFYKLDLLERKIEESAERLDRYLSYKNVCSQRHLESARSDYKNIARDREVKKAIPEAWAKILDEKDSLLIDLIAEKVESLCGYRPGPDMVADFISGLMKTPVPPNPYPKPLPEPTPPVRDKTQMLKGDGNIGFELRGKKFEARNARDVFIQVMEKLSDEGQHFCERFASRPKHGTKRRYIAKEALINSYFVIASRAFAARQSLSC